MERVGTLDGKRADAGTADTLQPVTADTADTLAPGAVDSGEIRLQQAFAGDERYQVKAFLGAGGAGRVYRAYDARLGRDVAIKVLSTQDPEQVSRLLHEARAQARVEHPHVCKVYEIGEIAGRAYISMQLIDGRTLASAAPALTLEQKVAIVHDVADAVHAAHRLGFIHRDLKPTNVMVEERSDGSEHAYVMDFGLARQLEGDAASTHAIAGTPAFMAPEQAIGGVVTLDRRTDVYGLGATLYSIIAGRPPHDDTSTMATLLQIANEDPVPLRKVAPSTPRDLETVVMKCLERQAQRRYDSARALADDLRRWLDGEPVQARRGSIVYRVRKKLVRHRAAAAAAAVVTLALVGFAWWTVRARAAATEHARLAQLFGRELESIDGMLRFAHLSPLHDTRGEKQAVRDRMQRLQTLVGDAAVPGALESALGRGHLALGDIDLARAELESAWKSGFRGPDVAWALGRSYGLAYQRARADAENIEKADQRRARIAELERTLRDPALSYLRAGGSARAETPDYVEALIAFYDKRYDDALAKAQTAESALWLYEASALVGDIHLRRATDRRLAGDAAGATAELALARVGYERAIERGRSDPANYVALCSEGTMALQLGVDSGQMARADLEAAAAACDRALAADPDDADAYATKGSLYALAAKHDMEQRAAGADVTHAIELAQAAVARNPRHAEAWYLLGHVNIMRAQAETGDPRAPLAAAEDALRHIFPLRPDARAWSDLGLVYTLRGEYEQEHGIDRKPTLEKAVAAFDHAIEIDGRTPQPYNNVGNAYKALGDDAHGDDARRYLEQAIAAYRKALALNPRYAYAWNNLGTAYTSLASTPGADADGALAEAVAAYAKSSDANPKFILPWVNAAEALTARAHRALDRGADPTSDLAAAHRAVAGAEAINAGYYYIGVKRAQIAIAEAELARARKRPTQPALTAATEALAWARGHHPDDVAEIARYEAEVYLRRAQWTRADGGDPRVEVEAGIARAQEALAINKQSSDARELLARLQELHGAVR